MGLNRRESPGRTARRVVLTAGAFALGVSGCFNSGSHRASPTTVTPTTVTPTTVPTTQFSTTTTTVPAVNTSPYTWTRDSSPTVDLGGGATADVNAVLSPSLSGHWLIAGTRIGADDQPAATVWISTDAVTWTATSLSSSGIASQALAAAQFRTETIVVGSTGSGSDRQAAVWISAGPGEPFVSVAVEPSADAAYMSTVTAGALGLFASGTVGGHLGFWSSVNGQEWTESVNAEKTIGGPPSSRVNSLLADGGVVYAAGSMRLGIDTEAALWSSGDGINWHQVLSAQTSFAGTDDDRIIDSIAPLSNGLVAVGSVSSGSTWRPASWISPNGVSWSLPSHSFPVSGAEGAGSAGTAVGPTVRAVSAIATLAGTTDLVAVGGEPGHQFVWQSANGLQWTSLPLPATASTSPAWEATLVGSFDGTTVVADGDPGQAHVLVDASGQWHEPSSNPKVFGPVRPSAVPVSLTRGQGRLVLEVKVTKPTQAVGTAGTVTEYLTSKDGQSWSAATAATAAATTATAYPPSLPSGATTASRLGTGWVAVGDVRLATLAYGEVVQPRSWTSPDGVHWTEAGPLPAPLTAGARPGGLCASVPPGPTVAAVGAADLTGTAVTPLAWYSANGKSWSAATVSPATLPGANDGMTGCFATATGLVAYGASSTASGGPAPALWRSTTGTAWIRQAVPDFVADSAYPIDTVARQSGSWVAVAGPAGPGVTGSAGTPGPLAPGAYIPEGPTAQSVWVSIDSGTDWDLVDTTASPWTGTDDSSVTAAGFAGSVPVVAGSVDGELAIWLGADNPLAAAGPTAADDGS